jgi:membrane protein
VLASGCWLSLQALGGVFLTQVLAGSSQTYGGFAAVVGLLTWLLIAAELVLIAAELNVVLVRRLWPRSLTGELLDTDKQVLRDSTCRVQADLRQHITVTFAEHDGGPDERRSGDERSDDSPSGQQSSPRVYDG